MKRNNYSRLAPFYDLISRSVYGEALIKAQRIVLSHLSNGDKVLIVGGGTGKILEEINKLAIQNIEVTYIDAAEGMIQQAKKKKVDFPIHFVQVYAEDFNSNQRWDVIITPFFFDNFQLEKCDFVFNHLDVFLKEDGLWLYVDFRPKTNKGNWWKQALLKTMYIFFKVFVRIETTQLVDMMPIFSKKYQLLEKHYSFHEFLISAIFRKSE